MKKLHLVGAVCAVVFLLKQIKKQLVFMCLPLLLLFGGAAHALTVNPNVGLTDHLFQHSAIGGNVTWDGDSVLSLTLDSTMTFDIHVEDAYSPVDEFRLVIGGSLVSWDTISSGDGIANGSAVIGPGDAFFEALRSVALGPGSYTIDLEQTAGAAGGAYFNMSAGTVVPLPTAVWLFGSGLLGLIGIARRKQAA